MKEEARESIKEIAEENKLLSLATVSDEEKAFNATAFYVFDQDFNFYILTEPDTDHCRNIEKNHSISLSIYDSHQKWGEEKRGLQVFGKAEHVSDENLIKEALDLYLERFPGLEESVSKPEEMDDIDSEFYLIRPERIKVFDEPTFGTETWINVRMDD